MLVRRVGKLRALTRLKVICPSSDMSVGKAEVLSRCILVVSVRPFKVLKRGRRGKLQVYDLPVGEG